MDVFELTTASTKSKLEFWKMRVREELGRPFVVALDMFTDQASVEAGDLLGTAMTVKVKKPDGSERYFHGLVSRFGYRGRRGRYHLYSAELRPWLWFLTRTTDCRIFQQKKVPDILESVFRDKNGFTQFRRSLQGTYRTWDYCVEYRESDFDFVSRLMEQEGIYYYFEHSQSEHKVVLADAAGAHQAMPGTGELLYRTADFGRLSEDHIGSWSRHEAVQTGAYTLRDYDFEKPSANLEVRSKGNRNHALSAFERYDYPGEYTLSADGNSYVKTRLDEQQAQYQIAEGEASSYDMAVGYKFKLAEFERKEEDGDYLCIAADYDIEAGDIEQLSSDAQNRFEVKFRAIPATQQFRPPQTTPKPVIAGPQTAVVVGKEGEEIWTDKYGRVKVQFFWDREGKKDENSSCWVRVAQVWAGKNWGAMHIPRIGQEVIVEFLEGDPDRPIITGRVYNQEQMPPYALPDNQTQSGLQSRSTKEGTPETFNELRFEDKKGEEQVYFHAEKNFDRVVENNDTLKVGFEKKDQGDQTVEVFNNQTTKIGVKDCSDGSQSIEIWKNQTLKVGTGAGDDGSQTIEVFKNRTETVKTGNETVTIEKGNRAVTVSEGNDTHTVTKGNREVTVSQGNDTLTVSTGNLTIDVSSGKCAITAAQAIELTVGGSSIKIEPAKITISAPEVAVSGDAKVAIAGATTQVNGTGMVQIQGGMVKIN